MTQIIEKPKTPVSKRANIGLYYIRNWKLLFEGIEWVLKQPKNQGEYFLTDAFQYMIEKGAKIKVIDVEGWYDAGKIETMIETNEAMLKRGRARRPKECGRFNDHRSRLHRGQRHSEEVEDRPNVSIGAGSVLDGAEISHSIVGSNAKIREVGSEELARWRRHCGRRVKGGGDGGDHSEVRAS
jgi:glucose-1-phosphate thymidylyltransferase